MELNAENEISAEWYKVCTGFSWALQIAAAFGGWYAYAKEKGPDSGQRPPASP